MFLTSGQCNSSSVISSAVLPSIADNVEDVLPFTVFTVEFSLNSFNSFISISTLACREISGVPNDKSSSCKSDVDGMQSVLVLIFRVDCVKFKPCRDARGLEIPVLDDDVAGVGSAGLCSDDPDAEFLLVLGSLSAFPYVRSFSMYSRAFFTVSLVAYYGLMSTLDTRLWWRLMCLFTVDLSLRQSLSTSGCSPDLQYNTEKYNTLNH